MIERQNGEKLKRKGILLLTSCLLIISGISASEENGRESSLSSEQALKWNGYTQVRYTHWEAGQEGFRIRRARLSLKGEILKNIDCKLQFDAVKSQILLDAQIGIRFFPHTTMTFGQFKVPFSLENLTSSSDLDTINRSQAVEKLCPGRDIGSQGRDIGFSITGKFSWIEYMIGIFNGSGINKNDTNNRKDIATRFVFIPSRFVKLGFSHYNGEDSASSGAPPAARNRTGAEIVLVQGKFSVKGEYILARDAQTERSGWYLQASYALIPRKIQALVKYDSFDKNNNLRGDRNRVITFGLNWLFSDKTKLQINYEYNDGAMEKNSKNAILAQFQAGF